MSELRLIWKPEVYVVGLQRVNEPELSRFLEGRGVDGWETDAPSAAEKLVEVAGRVCYESFKAPRPGGNAAYIGHILEVAHGSVCEHAIFNMIFSGISRSLSHELVRHRAGWGFSQLSQRFVDSSDVAFVVPPPYIDDVRLGKQYLAYKGNDPTVAAFHAIGEELSEGERFGLDWIVGVEASRKLYERGTFRAEGKLAHISDRTVRRKAAREAARSVLPNATETVVFATANVRAIRHMLEMRGSLAADAEFRRLACAVVTTMKNESPNLFADADVAIDEPGREHLTFKYHKV